MRVALRWVCWWATTDIKCQSRAVMALWRRIWWTVLAQTRHVFRCCRWGHGITMLSGPKVHWRVCNVSLNVSKRFRTTWLTNQWRRSKNGWWINWLPIWPNESTVWSSTRLFPPWWNMWMRFQGVKCPALRMRHWFRCWIRLHHFWPKKCGKNWDTRICWCSNHGRHLMRPSWQRTIWRLLCR